MKSIIILSDIHGCFKTLKALIKKLPKNVPICTVGDHIDRGPKSKEVIEFIRKNNYIVISGNHEDMLVNENGPPFDPYDSNWLYNGGYRMLQSYDDGENDPLFSEHRKWMETLPLYLEFKHIKNDKGQHLLVSHSSASEALKMHDQTGDHFKESIMWNRNLSPDPIKNIFNVFGHTPVGNKPMITEDFAAIDTGCVFKDNLYGRLTGLQFPEMKVFQQEKID
jgi:serine/threonine protein phosphatase 1